MERWVKATSLTYAERPVVWLNIARATSLHRDNARGVTVVSFGDGTHVVSETPEELIEKATLNP